jgi:hypothetical protein
LMHCIVLFASSFSSTGLTPSLILSVYPAIQHTVFDRLKAWYLKRYNAETLPSRVAFCLGICATMTALCKLSLLWMFSVKD